MKSRAKDFVEDFYKALRANKRWLLVGVVGACLFVPSARAAGVGDILQLLTDITGTIRNAIGTALNQVQLIQTDISAFRQEVIWPVTAINQAKSFVTSTRSQFGGLMAQIESIKNNSATLSNPIQLEQVFRSGQSLSLGQLQVGYTNVYRSAPSPTDARPAQRNMIDMDDALAMGSLKTTVLSDQTTTGMLGVADSIEEQSAAAAPGSAPMLSAEANVASLESQAYLAKILAAELRQEAGKLAHQNALIKQSAASTRNLQNQIQQVLTRP